MKTIRKEFTTYSIVLMAVAIAINIAVGWLVIQLKLPLYLDSIGTVLVGILIGPWAGAVTGLLASTVWTLSSLFPQAIFWAPVAAIIGALAGIFGKRIKSLHAQGAQSIAAWLIVILGGLVTGVVAAVLSAPIAAYVFGGVTGTGMDAVVALFRSAGLEVLGANLAQGLSVEPIDKTLTYIIAWTIFLGLPARLRARFSE